MNRLMLVSAKPEGDWWVIDVPGFGVTQAADLTDIEPTVQDLMATMSGTDASDIAVYVRLV